MTKDSHAEKRRKHMAVMDDRKADWQSEAMHQNKLLHDALTRIEELTAQLKMVLAREAETQVRHDSKVDALDAKLAKAVDALQLVMDACGEGKMVSMGVGGMTIDAQIRRSIYNRVPAWPIEEARAILDEIKG